MNYKPYSMSKLKFKRLDFSTDDFTKITSTLYPDSIKDKHKEALIHIQRPDVKSAYYFEIFNAFLIKKGLEHEFAEFKNKTRKVRKYFSGARMQSDYLDELERLEELYDDLLFNIDKTTYYGLGDNVWYQKDDYEKYAAVIQSDTTYDGSDFFVDINLNGKLAKNISLDRISRRW